MGRSYSVVAANRDETLERQSESLNHYRVGGTTMLGGRDVQSRGGSWMAVSEAGFIAIVTNNRELPFHRTSKSRGELVHLVLAAADPVQRLGDLDPTEYSNFNLLLIDAAARCAGSVYYRGTQQPLVRAIHDQTIGLSNGTVGSRWPKEVRGCELLREKLAGGVEGLVECLLDTQTSATGLPSNTVLGPDSEERLSAIFTLPCHPEARSNADWSPKRHAFGTVSSAIILVSDKEAVFYEVSWRGLGEQELRDRAVLMHHFASHHVRKELTFGERTRH